MIPIPGNAQHIGSREEQQDAFGFSDIDDHAFTRHGGVVAVVADGMGGHLMGRESSQLAVRIFLKEYMAKSPEETIEKALMRSLEAANHEVHTMAKKHRVENDSGTTLVAGVIFNDLLHFISVGDSRLYLCRQGNFTCLTRDHSFANKLDRLVELGKMSREEAKEHPDRNALTAFLGMDELSQIDTPDTPVSVLPGDRLLLCSDGLYGTLDENAMGGALSPPLFHSPQSAAEHLIEKTLERKKRHQDNVTVAILALEDDVTKPLRHRVASAPSQTTKPPILFKKGVVLVPVVLLILLGGIWAWQEKTIEPEPPPLIEDVQPFFKSTTDPTTASPDEIPVTDSNETGDSVKPDLDAKSEPKPEANLSAMSEDSPSDNNGSPASSPKTPSRLDPDESNGASAPIKQESELETKTDTDTETEADQPALNEGGSSAEAESTVPPVSSSSDIPLLNDGEKSDTIEPELESELDTNQTENEKNDPEMDKEDVSPNESLPTQQTEPENGTTQGVVNVST